MKKLNLIKRLWTDSHEKQSPQRFARYAAMLIMLLTLGVGQMWGADASSANIYYDNSSSKWSDVQILIGHSSYSSVASMTKLTNTNNLYYKRSYSWGGYSEFYFVTGCSSWGNEESSPTHRTDYCTNSGKLETNVGSKTWLFVSSGGSDGSSVSVTDCGTNYDNLNYTYTVDQKLTTNGGSSYSTSTASLATVKVSSYYLANATNTSATANNGTIAASKSSASCKAVRTATVTYSVSSVSSDYNFVGWYDGDTQKSIDATYNDIWATENKTITARFTKNFTVGDKIYLLRNSTWKNASGLNHYAAYFYGAGGNTWVNCERVGTSDYYYVTVPSGNWGYVIFVALNNATNNWSYKIYQTDDLMYDATHNGVEITGSNNSQSRISVYTGLSVIRNNSSYAAAPSITNSQTVVKSGSSITVNAGTETTGYHWVNWTSNKGSFGTATNKSTTFTPTASSAVATANYAINTQTVRFYGKGNTGGSMSNQVYTYGVAQALTSNAFTKTGYKFGGWATSSAGADAKTVAHTNGASITLNPATHGTYYDLYAIWNAKQCTINFDFDESDTGYGSKTGATTSTTATYAAAMTSVTPPTAANGWAFMGYFDAADGEGTQYYDGTGASVTNWNKDTESPTTLYAYYKKAEITEITLSDAIVAPNTSITATPTISPTPTGTTGVCWELQYSNGTRVPSQPTFTPEEGNAVSFNAPAASATYILQAQLRLDDCDGNVLSTQTTTFQVAGEHTVTVHYQDASGMTLAASTEVTGKPLEWTAAAITAPTVTGYTFHHWLAGDGVTLSEDGTNAKTGVRPDSSGVSNIYIKANYDGTLTAVYNKKKMVYFNNTLNWDTVYVYFYNNASNNKYWADGYGTGANKNQEFSGNKPFWEMHFGGMKRVAPGSNIWYFDWVAEGWSESEISSNITFANVKQALNVASGDNSKDYFHNAKVVFRQDYNNRTSLPMFVPLTSESNDFTSTTGSKYYSNGYWMNYPENTGYSLLIYNQKAKAGATKLYEIPFEFTEDFTMPMELVVDLEAGKTYGFEIKRADSKYYSNAGTMTTNTTNRSMSENQSSYCGLQTTAAGNYTFHFYYSSSDYRMDVTYPVAVNDYRIVYTDVATWSKDVHTASWSHPSRVITKNSSATETKKDTVSFFWSYGSTPAIKYQKCTGTGAGSVTWNAGTSIDVSGFSPVLTKKGVYNFIFEQPAGGASILLVGVEPYTGNYYIRTDCAGSTKWANFSSMDHQMTYSDYAEVNSGYSHYYTHWVTNGTNVKFCIANDYSMCITDTLVEDKGTVIANITAEGNDGAGTLNSASANIRFMWDQATNKISRAYIGGSTNISERFLVLEGDSKMYDQNGSALNISGLNPNEANLIDDQNFVYERTIQVNTGARAKLTAKYNTNIQYFKGSEGAFAEGTTIELLGGYAEGKHTMRIVYDFKTNRLVTAYVPSGTIDATIAINADLMIVREHQGEGQQLLFEGAGKLSEVHTVYGVMRFNRWTLNNKEKTGEHSPVGDPKSIYERSLYWISFPFNVNLSDVFGFGTYGVDWIIEYYDGAERAANGYWIDSDGFWKMVMPAQRANFTLEAGKGYVLAIDVDAMKDNNTTFWANDIEQVELFFPSATNVENISQTTAHTIVPAHECTIDRRTDKSVYNINKDRTKADSHWNMIGIPSYANYGATLTSDEEGTQTITWNSNPYTNNLPFLYEWNMTDDSYTVQSGTTYPFKAMHAYMVQYHGDLYWSLASATPTPSPIVARRAYAEKPQNAEFRLELQQNEKMVDQTFVNMKDAEEISAGFKFDEDLCKEFNAGKANIYTIIENYLPAAGNTLPMSEQTTLVPVGVKTTAAGEYTFAMPEGTNGVSVVLIDNIAGTRTNLALSDYTVALGKGDLSDRFILEISPVKQMPTDIENVQGDNVHSTKVRKVMIDGILYIVKDGKVFDARGAKVK